MMWKSKPKPSNGIIRKLTNRRLLLRRRRLLSGNALIRMRKRCYARLNRPSDPTTTTSTRTRFPTCTYYACTIAKACHTKSFCLQKSRRRPVENYEIFKRTRSPSTTEFRRVKRLVFIAVFTSFKRLIQVQILH